MPRRLLGSLLPAMVLMLGLAAPAVAQDKLEEGLWTGSVFTPDGEVFDLSYDVSYTEDGLAIELILPAEAGMGNVMAGDPMFESETLAFSLSVGEVVNCMLEAKGDGQYEGECVDSSGGAAVMTMIPPKDG